MSDHKALDMDLHLYLTCLKEDRAGVDQVLAVPRQRRDVNLVELTTIQRAQLTAGAPTGALSL